MAERQTIDINEPVRDLPGWAQPLFDLGNKILANAVPLAIGTLIILACLGVGGLVQLNRVAAESKAATQYATAVFEEDEEARPAALETAGSAAGNWGVEATYLAGEAALAKSEWDKARAAFEKVVNEHADSPVAPRAAEGLAFIDESTGAFEQALEGYRKVSSNWPDSFAARCQPYNIGRVQETLGQMRDAVASYERQAEVFEGSKIAEEANTALERLKISHPELFATDAAAAPAEAAPAAAEAAPETAAPAAEPAPAVDAAVAPAEPAAAPAESAPAAEAPAPAEAPAQQ